MVLPNPGDLGPFDTDQEFEAFKTGEENEARRGNYLADVQRIVQSGQIFAKVTYSPLLVPAPKVEGLTVEAIKTSAVAIKAAPNVGPYVAAAPETWLGQVIGNGQCVDYVEVAAKAPHTADWKRGTLVKGADANIPPGTVIATFDADGTYGNHSDGTSHAAIYLSQSDGGLTVLDQWLGQSVHKRLIRFSPPAPPGAKPVNDGGKFYVVV